MRKFQKVWAAAFIVAMTVFSTTTGALADGQNTNCCGGGTAGPYNNSLDVSLYVGNTAGLGGDPGAIVGQNQSPSATYVYATAGQGARITQYEGKFGSTVKRTTCTWDAFCP